MCIVGDMEKCENTASKDTGCLYAHRESSFGEFAHRKHGFTGSFYIYIKKLCFAYILSEFIALSPTFKLVFDAENRWCSASKHIKLLWEQCLTLLLLSLRFGVIFLQFFWGSVHFSIYTNFHPWKLLLNTRLLPLWSEIMSLIVILVGAAPEMFSAGAEPGKWLYPHK